MHVEGGFALVHAGLLPSGLSRGSRARGRSRGAIAGTELPRAVCTDVRDEPDRWSDRLTGIERLRVIINAMTPFAFAIRPARWCSASRGSLATRTRAGRRGSMCRRAQAATTPSSSATGRRWACAFAPKSWGSTAVASGAAALRPCVSRTGRYSRRAAGRRKGKKSSDLRLRRAREVASRHPRRVDRLAKAHARDHATLPARCARRLHERDLAGEGRLRHSAIGVLVANGDGMHVRAVAAAGSKSALWNLRSWSPSCGASGEAHQSPLRERFAREIGDPASCTRPPRLMKIVPLFSRSSPRSASRGSRSWR